MAVTYISSLDTGVSDTSCKEVWQVQVAAATTTFTITPTTIKAIYEVEITPMNAAAATGITSTYLNGFVPGAATAVFICTASSNYLVTVRGTVA